MWPFNRNDEVSAQDAILEACDFSLARNEFADMFRMINSQAKSEGNQVAFRQELVNGWKVFSERPCRETAEEWLRSMLGSEEILLKIFADCCPGGRASTYARLLGQAPSSGESTASVKCSKHDAPASAKPSPQLQEWLSAREHHLKLAEAIREDGGHIMLRRDTTDPRCLDEPLRSEAISYLRQMGQWSD